MFAARLIRTLSPIALLTLAACAADTADSDKGEALAPSLADGKADGLDVIQQRGGLTFSNDSAGESSAEFEGKGQFHAYTMTLAAGAELSLEITQRGTSRGLDSTLYVYGPRDAQGSYGSSYIAYDDDAGWGPLSKIEGFTAPEAGDYLVLVGTYTGKPSGYYRLESRCDNGACLPANPVGECVFGSTYRDIFGQSAAVNVLSRRKITDLSTLTQLERDQLFASVVWTYDQVTTPEEALDVVDSDEVNQVHIWDASSRTAYIAYEYGAGDNSYGMIVPADATTTAAYIQDGDLTECTASWGQERRSCASSSDCAAGLRCEGIFGGEGVCIDTALDQQSAKLGASCADRSECGPLSDGLVCAGETVNAGVCQPGWMRRTFAAEPYEAIPDNDPNGLVFPIKVVGLATVSTDTLLDLFIAHAAPEELRVTLTNPSGTEVVVYDGSVDTGEIYLRDAVLRGFPGDEDANGNWVLQIVDTKPGNTGTLYDFGLQLSSRWD